MPRSALVPAPSCGFQHQRARAVAEQHAGGAVRPVHDAAEGFGPDHQHAVGLTRDDQRIGIGQRKDEARADGLNIEGKAFGHAQIGLHHGGRGREGQVGGRGRHDDRVDVVRRQPGIVQRARAAGGQVGCGLAFGGEMAAFDAGARPDPFVGGIERVFEFALGTTRSGR